jgi:protein-S-isoprenylcysteine O-methyltransferase Ste14
MSGRSAWQAGARIAAHGALLVAPLAALGRFAELTRPQSLAGIAALLAFAEVERAARAAPDPARPGAPGTGLALTSALGLLATAWATLAWTSIITPLSWLGLPLLAAGIALRALAIRTLGPSFTSEIVAIPGQPVVTHGIYARLHHPSDVGLLLVALGLALLGGSAPAALVALCVVAPSVVVRMMREDALLAPLRVTRAAASRRPPGRESSASRCA